MIVGFYFHDGGDPRDRGGSQVILPRSTAATLSKLQDAGDNGSSDSKGVHIEFGHILYIYIHTNIHILCIACLLHIESGTGSVRASSACDIGVVSETKCACFLLCPYNTWAIR